MPLFIPLITQRPDGRAPIQLSKLPERGRTKPLGYLVGTVSLREYEKIFVCAGVLDGTE